MRLPLQLRRAYWGTALESCLFDDSSALNLMYIQAVTNIKGGLLPAEGRSADELAAYRFAFQRGRCGMPTCRAAGDKKAFMAVAQSLRGYGFEYFGDCTVSFPEVSGATTRPEARLE